MMIRWYAIPVAFLLLAAAGVPAVSQEEESKKKPQPLIGGSGNDKFYIFGTMTFQEEQNACARTVAGMWGEVQDRDRLFGSNNPEDHCRTVAEAKDTTYSTSTSITGSFAWNINLYPKIANGTPLREGEPFKVSLTLAITNINEAAYGQIRFGDVKPHFKLRLDNELLGEWDGDPAISPDTIREVKVGEAGGAYYIPYDIELGEAPATLDGGVLNLTVDISNFFGRVHTKCVDADDPKAPDPEQCGKVDPPRDPRRIMSKVGLSIDPARQGWIQIPFADGADQFFPRYIPPKVDIPDPDFDENVTEEDDNVTGNETDPAETGGATNNTTTTQVEKGFLPGFETALLVTSAFLALVLIGRVRGRPPVNGRL